MDAFPDAVPAEAYLKRSAEALAPHGLVPGETLALVSLCRDELTVELTRHVSQIWGPPFRMGSLAGMVFLGTSGVQAGVAHAPANADGRLRLVVYLMPHIGIGPDGSTGAVQRPGQPGATTACGALVGFRAELAAGRVVPGLDQDDLEICLMRQRLLADLRFGAVPDIAELTTIARDAIRADFLRAAAGVPDWAGADVAVLSGIQIHTPDGDLVQPGPATVRLAGSETEVPLEVQAL